MKKQTEVIFSGTKLREYLLRNGLTYKDAAELTGVDKNTIGKAARGGAVNVALLLRICNGCRIPVEWFFKKETQEIESLETEDISYYGEKKFSMVRDQDAVYGENEPSEEGVSWKIIHSKEEEILLLNRLIENYKLQIELLHRKIESMKNSDSGE